MLNHLKKLLYILSASKLSLFLVAVVFIFASCFEAFGIGIVGPFIALASDPTVLERAPFLEKVRDFLGIEQTNHFIAIIGLIAIFTFVGKSLIAWGTQALIFNFSNRQQRLLIIRMARGYLSAPYVYQITKNSSSITDRLIEIANSFSTAIFIPLLTTFSNLFLFISLFFLLCFTSFHIMIVSLIVLFPVFIFFNSFAPMIRQWGRQMRDSKADIIKIVNHAFGSIKETKVIGCEGYFENQIARQAEKLERSHRRFVTFKILPRFILECTIVVGVVAMISLSILFNSEGIGGATSALSVFVLASIRLLPAISNSINGINQIRGSSYTVDQIYYELKELSTLEKDSDNVVADEQYRPRNSSPLLYSCKTSSSDLLSISSIKFEKTIELRNITYRYPSSTRDIICNLSLSIDKGESIAFIGESGAGKTTLVDIILGLLVPQSGDIRVDGFSIYKDLRLWKNLIAYIPQTIFLIDDSIKRNIAFGVPEYLINEEKVKRAIHASHLNKVIDSLPCGIETGVGERGVLLSGGQRQRVGIARAIYHDREILVLDEATAALDNETEKLVTESLASLSSNDKMTLITIAHRLTTIRDCDKIYLFSEGKLVKSGSYSEVVKEVED